ncbi:MAG: nucleotidyltransferase family protein [Candidatus Spyradocola sp.]|jgi:glucose-1-phosphate thymidylyltransferase
MKAILLVAGYATRLYPLTKDRPKALLSVGGMPLLDHILRGIDAIDEVDAIHVVSNDKFYPQFRTWADAHNDPRLHVHDDGTREDGARLGAIGDIAFALRQANIDDDCLIVAGDNLLKIDYADFFRAYVARGRKPQLLAQKMDDLDTLRRFAVAVLDADGRVERLVEKPADPPSENGVFALYLYPAEAVRRISEYLAQGNSPDAPGNFAVWLAEREPVYAYVTDRPCYDIGTHESLALVRSIYGE